MMHEWVWCCDEAADHHLPIAAAFWIIWTVSMEECSSLTQNLMQIDCSSHSITKNVGATQYTCSLYCIYRPHWLVEWVIIVHTCAFQSTLLGCQVTSMLPKPLSLYQQVADLFFWTGLICTKICMEMIQREIKDIRRPKVNFWKWKYDL